MLNDWLPKQATSSLVMSPSRAPLPVAPVRPAHAPGNTCRGVSAPEVHGEPQLVRKPSDWMASNQVGLVQHGPTKMVFEFSVRPDLGPGRYSDDGRFSGAACAWARGYHVFDRC
jgi:hypothetical protein